MPVARINGKLLHFVHIPKTGGSSISSYLRAIGQVALYSREQVAWCRTTPQHMEMQTAAALLPYGFIDARFGLLRDPVARMLSEYRYRFTRLPAPAKVPAPHERRVELDWGETFCGSFAEWVDCVFERYEEDPFTCDNHIRPQAQFVDPRTQLFLFEAGLQPVFDWISEVTGAPAAQVELDRNASRPLDIALTPDVQRRIEDFYAEDYALIGRVRQAGLAEV